MVGIVLCRDSRMKEVWKQGNNDGIKHFRMQLYPAYLPQNTFIMKKDIALVIVY